MFAQMLIVFKPFHNHIKHIGTNAKICLCERNEVFAVIRINPHAILKANESVFIHKTTETRAHALPPFGDIKNNYSPTPIPFPLFCNCCPLCLHLEHALPFLCYACITLSVFLNKCNEPFRHEPSERRLRLIIKPRTLLVSWEKSQKLSCIRYCCGNDHNTAKYNGRKHCFLKRPPASSDLRLVFHLSHQNIVPSKVSKTCRYSDKLWIVLRNDLFA